MFDIRFVLAFKSASEGRWREISIKEKVWGFQIQAQTRWNSGLPDETIAEYEAAFDACFPADFKIFLKYMNGTDLPAIDIRAGSREPRRFAPGFYSYPRDLAVMKQLVERVGVDRAELAACLAEQGFQLPEDAKLIPIFGHRYLVCSPGLNSSAVLSIWDASDAIVYGHTLKEYLEKEVLS